MNKRTAPQAAAGAALPATSDQAAPTAPVQAPATHQDWPPDQYTGIGGDYLRDPVTGIRTPAHQQPTESHAVARAADDDTAAA